MKIELNRLIEVSGVGQKTIQRARSHFLKDINYISEYNQELKLEENSINNGDCLELMNGIPDKSVDMILADLPYGTTACSWDSVIDLDKLWLQYERIIKDNGAIVLTASQPFTSELTMSNIWLFKYDWTWQKSRVTNVLNAKKQPLRIKEDILVFSKGKELYNPQGVKDCFKKTSTGVSNAGNQSDTVGKINQTDTGKYIQTKTNYPLNILEISSEGNTFHPTQKPVALFEYLIKTYTNEGDLALDNVSGSGTTAVACINTGRKYICIEKNEEYYHKSLERISKIKHETN